MTQTPPQDSVSDVERLRELSDAATRGQWRAVEHDGSIWIDADDEGDMPVALMMGGSPHNQDRADAAFILAAVAFARAALSVPINKIGEDAWQDMATAPRDGRYILVAIAEGREGHLAHQAGRMFVVRHAGMAGEYDMGWNLHPGYGGCSDFDFAGWMPAPQPPAIRRLSTSTDKGVR